MNKIEYGVFCEDEPQSLFIDNFLGKFNNTEIQLIKNQSFYRTFKPGRPRGKVKSKYKNVCNLALSKYHLDLCLVGYDLDYHDEKVFNQNYEEFIEIVSDFGDESKKIVVFIPVQCIEHWLWYLSDRDLKKGALEGQRCKEAKKNVYGTKRPTSEKAIKITNDYTRDMDIESLKAKSYSFKRFFDDIGKFIENIK